MSSIRLKDMLVQSKRRGELPRLIDAVTKQNATLQLVRALLPAQYASHCISVSVDGNQLSVVADSSVWANRLRFETNHLLAKCGNFDELAHIESIRFRTKSKRELESKLAESERRNHTAVSTDAIDAVSQAVESVEHPSLRLALADLQRTLERRKR